MKVSNHQGIQSKRNASRESTNRSKSSKKSIDWISLLESTKANVTKLLDGHIKQIKIKQQNQMRKNEARRECIQKLRMELDSKFQKLCHLLDELEKYS